MKGGRVGPLRVDAREYSTTRVQIRCTPLELFAWKAAAENRRMTLSNFVRQAVKQVLSRAHERRDPSARKYNVDKRRGR